MAKPNIPVKRIFDYVCEIPTHTELDYEYQQYWFANEFQNLHGGCSAAVKTINGETIVARNLDFNISNKSAYVVRTAVPGSYKTVGMGYIPWFGPDYEDALENGLPDDYYRLLPFALSDMLNEKGLYIEIDMRTEEFHDGKPRYMNYGLNPGGERVSVFALMRYAVERCATVDEVLEMLKELDVYTVSADGIQWGFAYMVADATGNYGLIEIAGDKVHFIKNQPVQTNCYITPELAENQLYRSGLGRYHTLMANYFKANSEQGMQDLIDLVRYSTQYSDMDNCAFDWRHEEYDPAQGIDYAKVMDPACQDEIYAGHKKYSDWWKSLSRQEKQDLNTIWETAFSVITNVTKGTMRVRCFEDESLVLNLKVE